MSQPKTKLDYMRRAGSPFQGSALSGGVYIYHTLLSGFKELIGLGFQRNLWFEGTKDLQDLGSVECNYTITL